MVLHKADTEAEKGRDRRTPIERYMEFSRSYVKTFRTFPASNPLEQQPISASNTLIIRREPRRTMKRIPSGILQARSRQELKAV